MRRRRANGFARRGGFARQGGFAPTSMSGFALIDVLVALLISSIALLAVLGGIALSARTARAARQRFMQIVAARNQDASEQRLQFIQETIPK
jgi:Tfp pilus assembly protein PilV